MSQRPNGTVLSLTTKKRSNVKIEIDGILYDMLGLGDFSTFNQARSFRLQQEIATMTDGRLDDDSWTMEDLERLNEMFNILIHMILPSAPDEVVRGLNEDQKAQIANAFVASGPNAEMIDAATTLKSAS